MVELCAQSGLNGGVGGKVFEAPEDRGSSGVVPTNKEAVELNKARILASVAVQSWGGKAYLVDYHAGFEMRFTIFLLSGGALSL